MQSEFQPKNDTEETLTLPVVTPISNKTEPLSLMSVLHPEAADTENSSVSQLLSVCARDGAKEEIVHLLGGYAIGVPLTYIAIVLLMEMRVQYGVILGGAVFGLFYTIRETLRKGCARDTALFAQCGPEAVPDLIAGLTNGNSRVQTVASMVLAQLIPTLTRDQFETFSHASKEDLYDWLSRSGGNNIDSRTTLVQALGTLADDSAIPYLERVCRRSTPSIARRRFRRTAKLALQALVERISTRDEVSLVAPVEATEEADLTEESSDEARALYTQLRKHSDTHASPGMRYGYLLANWCIITPYVGLMFAQSISEHDGLLKNALWGFLALVSTQLYRVALTGKETRMARELAALDDIHAVAPLAEALEWPDYDMRNVARTALIRLLPRIKMSDGMLLNSKQRRCLNIQLDLARASSYLDAELQVQILRALQEVGDLSSLQAVKSLVAAKPTNANQKRVHRAAQVCLPLIQERAHLNEGSHVLLRASSLSNTSVDTLVRPASSAEIPAQELLRSSRLDENE